MTDSIQIDAEFQHIPYIEKILHTFVSVAKPERIILFGSYARGDFKPKSDVDFMILIKGLKNKSDMYDEIELSLDNCIRIPIDYLLMDFEGFYELKDTAGYVYKNIYQEGKVVYGSLQHSSWQITPFKYQGSYEK